MATTERARGDAPAADAPADGDPPATAAGPARSSPPSRGEDDVAALFDIPALKSLMDRFQVFSGLATAVVDLEGRVLVEAGSQDICALFHRVHPEARLHCIESDVQLSSTLNQGPYALYRCKNGLWDMATPVRVDGRHVANVFCGQFLLEDEPSDPRGFEDQALRYGFDRDAYLAALAKVPRVSRERAQRVMEFYVALAQILVHLGHGTRGLREAVRAQARVEEERRADLVRARLVSIIESSSDAIIGKDLEGRITSWNRGAERMYGYSAAEMIGRPMTVLAPGREAEVSWLTDRVRRGESVSHHETVRVCKDGTPLEVSLAVSPIRDAQGVLVGVSTVARDVTDHRRAEREVRSAGLYARSLIEASLDPLVTISPAGKITDVNRATEEATGVSREELIGTDFADYFSEPDLARTGYQRVLREGLVRDYPLTLRHRDGHLIDVLYNATVYRNEAGEPQGVFAAARDVTEHRRMERALERERDRVTAIMEASPVAMVRVQKDGRLDFANAAAQALLGLRRADIEQRTYDAPEWGITDWDGGPFPPEQLPFAQVMRTGQPAHVNHAIVWPDGRRVLLSIRGAPLRDAAGRLEGAVFGVEDATERRRMEEQLRQSQKLEAVGRLAGGVAHDFNNLLTAILSGSDRLLEALREPDPLREEASDIHEAAFRAAALTRQLLIFSRKQVVQPRVVDLWEVVSGLERILRRLIGEDIQLDTAGAPGGLVKVDPGQLEQVIVNLVVNARDAMPRGGRLRIETAQVTLETGTVERHVTVAPGTYLMLAVTDTGCGMTPEVQSHLFEPFFTTKEPGKGTGLGLSTVYGIVTQAGGHVWAYSESGRGSVFKVFLPRVGDGAQADAPLEPVRSARGSETVLVVEDEPLVRKLAVRVLRAAGYTVLEASDGVEALEVAEQAPGLAALVTDTVMPRMGGEELAHRLRTLRPEIRVLFMSGYTDRGFALQQELSEGSAFLQKPFSATVLANQVRELLDRRG